MMVIHWATCCTQYAISELVPNRNGTSEKELGEPQFVSSMA